MTAPCPECEGMGCFDGAAPCGKCGETGRARAPIDRAALRARLARVLGAVHPDMWFASTANTRNVAVHSCSTSDQIAQCFGPEHGITESRAALIAAAVNALGPLLDECDRLEARAAQEAAAHKLCCANLVKLMSQAREAEDARDRLTAQLRYESELSVERSLGWAVAADAAADLRAQLAAMEARAVAAEAKLASITHDCTRGDVRPGPECWCAECKASVDAFREARARGEI